MLQPATFAPGLLAAHQIENLHKRGAVAYRAPQPGAPPIVQPASLDLRLGRRAWRVRASFLPGPNRTVAAGIAAQPAHELELTRACVLEPGTVTIVELEERLALPATIGAAANPKSSTGRIDVFVRVITDRGSRFDLIEPGYRGPLFAEISPRTFPIRVRTGSRLAQIRFACGQVRLDEAGHRDLHARESLVTGGPAVIAAGIAVSVDLSGANKDGLVGYRAKRHTGIIDVDATDVYAMHDFWEPVVVRERKELVLDPGEFYLLASKEAVRVPPDHAAEMTPFDPLVGEFRVHYAGFFDPGFGAAEAGGAGARAVLEVRSRDVPFVLEDGQVVAQLVYEAMSERPKTLYGETAGSHYQAQGLRLSKHFKA